ncbi:MAG: FAD-dependent oxidoreductase, partial [Rubrivivax sp.]
MARTPSSSSTRPASRRIAVIGAGISGLACARTMMQAGHEVTLLEKSPGYGGRRSCR